MIITVPELRKLARTHPNPAMRIVFKAVLADEKEADDADYPVRRIPRKIKDETPKEERPRP